jgi:AbiU2
MTDPAIVARANEIIDRLFAVDEEVANGRAFRALLEDLHTRDLSVVKEPHIAAIAVVRAAILRALISSVVACLDRGDRRRNRASIGQILSLLLEDAEVAALFKTGSTALRRAKDEYEDLVESELFERGRNLRNKAIAHLLTTNGRPPTARPTEATYETFYELHEAAERLTIGLFEACSRGKPTFSWPPSDTDNARRNFLEHIFCRNALPLTYFERSRSGQRRGSMQASQLCGTLN